MPNLLGRHYRMLSAPLAMIGELRIRVPGAVVSDLEKSRPVAMRSRTKAKRAGGSHTARNHQPSVAGHNAIQRSRLRRIADRGAQSS